MSFVDRIVICLGCVLFLAQCSSRQTRFSYTHHSLKIQYDPVAGELIAIDTLTVQYHENVDQIYFFLHDSLHLERVGVGHQEFSLGSLPPDDLEAICATLDDEWTQMVDKSQIVTVRIPKSLYSERIEVRYRGQIDLAQEAPIAWHPLLPGMQSTFQVTALIPQDHVIMTTDKTSDDVDGAWRLVRWNTRQPAATCALSIRRITQKDEL